MELPNLTARRWRAFITGILLSAFAAVGIACFVGASGAGAHVPTKPPVKTAAPKAPAGREIAVLSGGCFWSEEALFEQLKGVDKALPGYAGGWVAKPSYDDVCTETTGHAETVEITFDPKVISYHDLLTVFLTTMDPTTLNRQGGDSGTSYRSAIWYLNPTQKATAEQVIAEITKAKVWSDPIVTTVSPFVNYYPAESYHVNYYNEHPDQGYCQAVIAPKLEHFRKLYASKLK